MTHRHKLNCLAALLLLVLACAVCAETIRVGAAISLKEAVGEAAANYQKATGEQVEFVFGSSGQVAAQIRSGAEIDLFISAANQQVDELLGEKLADADTRRIVASNRLVLIVPGDAKNPPSGFDGLRDPSVRNVAIGAPRTVPAGLYAEQVIRTLKLTDALAEKLVYGTNVRQVLAYVERGEVSAGMVYATDAMAFGPKVRVVATADPNSHEPIVYPGIVVRASRKPDAAKRFLDYLSGVDARAVLKRNGFLVTDGPATKPSGP